MSVVTFDVLRERFRERPPQRIVDPTATEAAVALILVPRGDQDLAALFIRRAEVVGDPWSGQMALPGGRRDPEDPDLLATAARETLEETGISLPLEAELGVLDDFTPRSGTLPRIVVRPHVFGLAETPSMKVSSEVAYHLWVPIDELRRSYSAAEVDIHGARTRVPAFVLGPHVIWGITERIISPFMAAYLGD